MEFAWDEAKSRANRRKHGISFATAIRVFEDPNAVSYMERVVEGEVRWHTLGLVGGTVVLLVVHTIEEDYDKEIIRVISARKAAPGERRLYDAS